MKYYVLSKSYSRESLSSISSRDFDEAVSKIISEINANYTDPIITHIENSQYSSVCGEVTVIFSASSKTR